ncbi:MAG: sigma-E processing peptidase SpoIIGA [Bacilli bacterium]|jgi:stage II sporulation protein GA (sporulation sigma-E factor processing peptidase)
MKIYLDLIFILNFLFDFLLLLVVGIILRRNSKITRLLGGAFIGGLSILVLFLTITSLELFIIKIIISILMVIATFGYKDLRYTCRNLFYLYTVSLLLGGFLYFLNLEFSYRQDGLIFYHNGLSINWILLLILSPIILYVYLKQALNLKNNYSNYYLVDIYFKNGTKKKFSAFLDTGNKLIDPYFKRPIILVNKKEINNLYQEKEILLVPYDTLNNHSLLKCIIPEKIEIVGVGIRKKVLIGISEKNINLDGIDCILHAKLLEG